MDLLSKNDADKWFAEHSDTDIKIFANSAISTRFSSRFFDR